jgi:hypothetical protein
MLRSLIYLFVFAAILGALTGTNFVGIVFALLAVALIAAVFGNRGANGRANANEFRCPFCQTPFHGTPVRCGHCGQSFRPWPPK